MSEEKKKAETLIQLFFEVTGDTERAKSCAIRCVDEIIKGIDMLDIEYNQDQSSGHILDFYREVRKEIEKL